MKIAIIIIALLILAVMLNVNFRKLKKISNNSLDYITKKLPDNKEICKQILNILGNNNVTIEEQKEYKNSLYIVITNKIILGKMKIDSLKVQTISHECIHSIQNRKILLSNFIFSNIVNIYFIVSLILTIFGLFEDTNLQLYILTIFCILTSCIRNYLETNAMSRAPYISEKYLKTTDLEEKEQELLLNQYNEINYIGIPLVNYITILKEISKPLIYAVLFCI